MKRLGGLTALAAVLALGACVMPQARLQPQAVRLSQSVLTVQFNDGSVCRAEWRAAPQGKFNDCGGDFTYVVTPEKNLNILADIASGVNAEADSSLFSPLAKITLADPSGRQYEFDSTSPIKNYDFWNEK